MRMMTIVITVLYNMNILKGNVNYMEGDFLQEVGKITVFRNQPTMKYLMEDLPQEVFSTLNHNDAWYLKPVNGSLMATCRSMMAGDVLRFEYVTANGRPETHYQSLEATGWRIL